MKKKKLNVHRLLEQAGVSYTPYEYAWSEEQSDAKSAAADLHVPFDSVYKTLVTEGDKTGPVVCCVPASSEVDLKKLARVSGNKKTAMLAMKDLEKVTGYLRGGCSPIGMKKRYPTYIASAAESKDKILVSAGRRGYQVEISPQDLQQLTDGSFADIIK